MNRNLIVGGVILLAVIIIAFVLGPFYIIQEGEQVAITQFSELVEVQKSAGLHLKVPGIQNVNTFPNRILAWDGDPQVIPTKEKRLVYIDVTARWKITDLTKFYKTVQSLENASRFLAQVIDPSVRNIISSNNLAEAIRSTNEIRDKQTDTNSRNNQALLAKGLTLDKNASQPAPLAAVDKGRRELAKEILQTIKDTNSLEQLGITVIDVLTKQIRFSDDQVEPVYKQMIAERNAEADLYRSAGEGAIKKKLGETEFKQKEIISEARRISEETRGKADAEAAALYNYAYSQDPEFYTFWKAIQSYKETLPNLNKVLTTDADYFKYLYSPFGR